MRSTLHLLLLMTLPVTSCAEPEALFREVAASSGPITLGEVWEAPGDTIVGLPEGSIAGVGPAAVYRTRDGVVRGIWMNYPQSTDFDSLARVYRKRLGEPARHERPADPEGRELLVWEDLETRFQLVSDPRRSVSTVYGVLSDRGATGSL